MRYSVFAELKPDDWPADSMHKLADDLKDLLPGAIHGPNGYSGLSLVVPAESARDAVGLAFDALPFEPVSMTVMLWDEFELRRAKPIRESDVMSVTQAADWLGLHPSAVRRNLESGAFAGFRVGATWVLPAAQFEIMEV